MGGSKHKADKDKTKGKESTKAGGPVQKYRSKAKKAIGRLKKAVDALRH